MFLNVGFRGVECLWTVLEVTQPEVAFSTQKTANAAFTPFSYRTMIVVMIYVRPQFIRKLNSANGAPSALLRQEVVDKRR